MATCRHTPSELVHADTRLLDLGAHSGRSASAAAGWGRRAFRGGVLPDQPAPAGSARRDRGGELAQWTALGGRDRGVVSPVKPRRSRCGWRWGCDFADLFEIKAQVRDRSDRIETTRDPEAGGLAFRTRTRRSGESQDHGDRTPCHRRERLRVAGRAARRGGRGRPRSRSLVDASGLLVEHVHRDFGDTWAMADDSLSRWKRQVPAFESGSDALTAVFHRSVDATSGRSSGSREDGRARRGGRPSPPPDCRGS